MHPDDEGGATAAEAAEVTQRNEGRLSLMGVEKGWLLLPVLVTGPSVGGGVCTKVIGLGVDGGVGDGVASGVGSGGDFGEGGGVMAVSAVGGARSRGVEGSEEGGVAVRLGAKV